MANYNNFVVSSGYSFGLGEGDTGENGTVLPGGRLYVWAGASAINVTVSNGGTVYYNGTGEIHNTTILSGGRLDDWNGGGHAYDTVAHSGAQILGFTYVGTEAATFAETFSGTVYCDFSSAVVNSGWNGNVGSDAYGSDITVNNGGTLNVYNGGLTEDVEIQNGGRLFVWDGASASDITVSKGGVIYYNGAGVIRNATILSGGKLDDWNGGGHAYDTVAHSGAQILGFTYAGTEAATFAETFSGTVYCDFSSALVNSGWNGNVGSDGHGTDLTVKNGGTLNIYNGGLTEDVEIQNGGRLFVWDGASASDITVSKGGVIYYNAAGVIRNATILSGGKLDDYSGGGHAYDTVAHSGAQVLGFTYIGTQPGIFAETFSGTVYCRFSSAVVNSGWNGNVGSGGHGTDITVKYGGNLNIYANASASDITVSSGGRVMVSSGGTIGAMNLLTSAVVSAYKGAKVNFDLRDRTASDVALVNNLALVRGTPTYTITVAGDQAAGIYTLAGGVSEFTQTVTVCTAEECFGTVSVGGEALSYNGYTYGLSTAGSNLVLSVTGSPSPSWPEITLTGEFATIGYGDLLTIDGTGTVKLMSFSSKAVQTIGSLDRGTWEVAGAFDFDGDGLLELGFTDKNTGNVFLADDLAGGISDEKLLNGTCLGMLGRGYSFYGAGSFDGKAGQNDILLQGPAFGDPTVSLNYGLPVWVNNAGVKQYDGWLGALVNTWQDGDPLKGDTSDPADINAKNYKYDIVGIGDFNGDGRSDVMLQNTMPSQVSGTGITGAGDVFVFLTGDEAAVQTGAAPTVCYSGKVDAVDLNGWGVAGTGDFNHDGIDDVLLLNQADGGLACWMMNYGQMQYSTWIGIKPADREISGIWDVNADGMDDVVFSTGTGYEAWTIQSGNYLSTVVLA